MQYTSFVLIVGRILRSNRKTVPSTRNAVFLYHRDALMAYRAYNLLLLHSTSLASKLCLIKMLGRVRKVKTGLQDIFYWDLSLTHLFLWRLLCKYSTVFSCISVTQKAYCIFHVYYFSPSDIPEYSTCFSASVFPFFCVACFLFSLLVTLFSFVCCCFIWGLCVGWCVNKLNVFNKQNNLESTFQTTS